MKKILMSFTLLALVCGVAAAETWSGKLVDAACAAATPTAKCAPTAATTSFALHASGKMIKLDAEGNTKASEALKSRADRAKDPNAPTKATDVMATVTGTLEGDTVKVESINIE